VLAKAAKIFKDDDLILALYAHSIYWQDVSKEEAQKVHNSITLRKKVGDINDPAYRALDTASAHYELFYGDREVGEKTLVRALASGEAPFEAYLLRGQQLMEHRRVAIAREQFKRATTLQPLDPRPLTLLAQSYLLENECNYKWVESLALRAATLSCWRDEVAINILINCAVNTNDELAESLYKGRYYDLCLARDLDVIGVREAVQDVQRLRSLAD